MLILCKVHAIWDLVVVMKIKKPLILFSMLLMTLSCAKDMSFNFNFNEGKKDMEPKMAIVTVKQSPAKIIYFQLDDKTRLFPQNYILGYSGMERLMCSLVIDNSHEDPVYGKHAWIDWEGGFIEKGIFHNSITSSTALDLDDPKHGLDIPDSWVNSVEDGFLTLEYKTWWGFAPAHHDLYLVAYCNLSDPYEVWLYQNTNGDRKDYYDSSFICFDINELPDTGDEYKPLTLKWTSPDGKTHSKRFEFKTRK